MTAHDTTMTADEPSDDRPLPNDGQNQLLTATVTPDPEKAFHALAAEYEERAAIHLERIEGLSAEKAPEKWAQSKGMLDAYRSAAVAARSVALSWDAADAARSEVRK